MSSTVLSSRSCGSDLVEHAERVERARVADERDELGEDVEQPGPVIADGEVRGDVPGDLGLAPSETSMAAWRKSKTLAMPTYGTAW
jgi:hypothetical protein